MEEVIFHLCVCVCVCVGGVISRPNFRSKLVSPSEMWDALD
jgi:hypothetical protein